ncbi:MAG: trans-aconitate 2-methyltransferase [Wenzhouxiangellaceae bacterium]
MAEPSLYLGQRLLDCARAAAGSASRRRVLELCCGTGHFALSLARAGYQVIAVDHSPAMIEQAVENRDQQSEELESGGVEFLVREISELDLPAPCSMVLAVGNAINHLRDRQHLEASLKAIARCAEDGAVFAFDFNTQLGLQSWNHVSVQDGPERVILVRGSYVPGDALARTQIVGFEVCDDGRWTRFDECVTNLALDCSELRGVLERAGWAMVDLHDGAGNRISTDEAERHPLILVVARKQRVSPRFQA